MERDQAFEAVQHKLVGGWRADQRGSTTPHLVVALPSFNVAPDLMAHYATRLPALEQRYLMSILLLEDPATRLVYLTSRAVPDYLVEYYVELSPHLELQEVYERLTLISVDDDSPRPLAAKLLDRPDLVDSVRELGAGLPSMIEPWNVGAVERDLAVALDMPIYGPHPRLWRLGSKSGARRIFADEGVPCPGGAANVFNPADVIRTVVDLRRTTPSLGAVVVKLDDSAAGDGNAVLDLHGLPPPGSVRERSALRRRLFAFPGWFVQALATDGGIAEAWIEGEDYRSPSVQLTITPLRDVVVLSTHDQILGGHSGQIYEGCRFPADGEYAGRIAEYGLAIGRRLAREGVVGRFAVDFALVRDRDDWRCHALEINLRKGGTTHPLATCRLLMHGEYDARSGTYHDSNGQRRYYVATDNLLDPSWLGLDPREVVKRVADAGLSYDVHRRVGVVLHMLECLPIDGRFGLTAFGASREEAEAFYEAVSMILPSTADAREQV